MVLKHPRDASRIFQSRHLICYFPLNCHRQRPSTSYRRRQSFDGDSLDVLMSTHAPWSNPAQHPYLVTDTRPSLKRKHSYYTSASSEVPSSSPTDYSPASDASDLPTYNDSGDTTIDASQQGSFRPFSKRRRCESQTGVEGEFDELALEQGLHGLMEGRDAALDTDAGMRETSQERMERFWKTDGEVEVDMLPSEAPSPSSVIHPSSFHSPAEMRATSTPLPGGSNWYEPEKDSECSFLFSYLGEHVCTRRTALG